MGNMLAHGIWPPHEKSSMLHPLHSRNGREMVHPHAARVVEVGVHVAIGGQASDYSVLVAAAGTHSHCGRHRSWNLHVVAQT